MTGAGRIEHSHTHRELNCYILSKIDNFWPTYAWTPSDAIRDAGAIRNENGNRNRMPCARAAGPAGGGDATARLVARAPALWPSGRAASRGVCLPTIC